MSAKRPITASKVELPTPLKLVWKIKIKITPLKLVWKQQFSRMDQQNSDIEKTPATPDDQQISSSPSDKQTSQLKPRTISGFPKRCVLLLMIFIGFVNIYAMRVNLNVALVAMVNNQTIIKGGVSIVKVHETSPLCVWSSYLDRCVQLTVLYAQDKLRPAKLRGL